MSDQFTIKDSGQRQYFVSGMQRDTTEGKMRSDLIYDGPMFLRWVKHLTKGAVKYIARNWMKAQGQEEYERFLDSANRHFTIWFFWMKYGINIEQDIPTRNPLSEDHAAAVFFNINGAEYVRDKLMQRKEPNEKTPIGLAMQAQRRVDDEFAHTLRVGTTDPQR